MISIKIGRVLAIAIMQTVFMLSAESILRAQTLQLIDGSYYCEGNNATITISNNELSFSNESDKDITEDYILIDGEFRLDSASSVFKWEHTDIYNGTYLGEYRWGEKMIGHYLLFRGSNLYYSPVKTFPGITRHFSGGVKCVNTNENSSFETNEVPVLNLYFSDFDSKSYYLAFEGEDQKMQSELHHSFLGSIGSLNCCLDLSTLAEMNINAFVNDDKGNRNSIPVIGLTDYNQLVDSSIVDKVAVLKDRYKEDFVLVVDRVNPSRERVVNKLFNRKVEGQVMVFEFIDLR